METEHELRFLMVDFEKVMNIIHYHLEKAEQINLQKALHFIPDSSLYCDK
jgi:hypothetical protein